MPFILKPGIQYMIRCVCYIALLPLLIACSATRNTSISQKKHPRAKLEADYAIFRGALEESHPGLYWFTSPDSMDREFNEGYAAIKDSMSEREFRMLLLKVVAAMRCGHTSVQYSRRYSRYLDTARLPLFPLAFKVWKDSLAVTANLNAQDSILQRGTVITSINGRSSKHLIDTFLLYTTGDGFSQTGRYQSLSSYGSFGVLHKNLFGLPDTFDIGYLAPDGSPQQLRVPLFHPPKDDGTQADSANLVDSLKPEKYTQKERRTFASLNRRHVQIDTTLSSAYMMLNTFARGNGLRRFFRSSFRFMNRANIRHLVVDVRSNGGGDAGHSTKLTRYLSDHPFVIADSLYAIKRSSKYRRLIPWQPFYWLLTTAVTRKKQDGHFHFRYFERHRFKPVRKHHFKGNVYILTGGNSFSATTLFAQELKGQPNVRIIGEETGGGSYGNNAWIIPHLRLPHTKLRVSIPKFRLVMRKDLVREGRGVLPDIPVAPTVRDIRDGRDVKIEAVRRLIIADYRRRTGR